jgi:ribose 1,5-bisphosphokinase
MAELIYLVGASGVGKDSLLKYVRECLPHDAPVMIAHRYITRPQEAGGENHIALTEGEFAARMQRGCFSMSWYSHQTWYGIGREVDQWLSMGVNVMVNGSRAYLDKALQIYPDLIPILVTAEPHILRRRLEKRGREDSQQIDKRLQLAQQLDRNIEYPQLHRIANNGDLSEAGEALLRLIQDRVSQACA